jgi:hypothetical protein
MVRRRDDGDDDARVTDRGVPALNGGPLSPASDDIAFFGQILISTMRLLKTHIARAPDRALIQ